MTDVTESGEDLSIDSIDTGTLDRVQEFLQQTLTVRQMTDILDAGGHLLEAGGKLLGAPIGYSGECLDNIFHIRHRMKEGIAQKFRMPLLLKGQSFLKDMFSAGVPYVSHETTIDPLVPSVLKTVFMRNVIAIPVNAGSRQFGFLLSGISGNPFEIAFALKQYVEIFHLQTAATLTNMVNQAEAKRAAETDETTQLMNKRALSRHLQEQLTKRESNEFTMMLLIDLDQLKRINDRYGPAAGDSAIQAVATCLHEVETEKCKAFRVDNDEFMVITNVVSPLSGLRLAEEIQNKLSIFKLPEGSITVSIGISYCGLDATSFDELMEGADEALRRAKYAGGARVEINRLVS